MKAQRVQVVDKGILKNFLMSRRPLEGFPVSNGHGRAAPGADPVSRQSNLIVETSKPVTFQELRKMLITEARKQGKKYGYFFKDVVGGFTTTDRYNPNAFNIFPQKFIASTRMDVPMNSCGELTSSVHRSPCLPRSWPPATKPICSQIGRASCRERV